MNAHSTSVSNSLTDPIAALYQEKSYHADERSQLLDWFRFEDKRVLDVGCGTGAYAREMQLRGMEVHGITLSPEERDRAAQTMNRVWLANVETWENDYAAGFFDAILLSHVLEHLVAPAQTLARLSHVLRPGGRVYVALPNIAYWRYRVRSLFGRFDYEEVGPMDKRHLRFFTFDTAQKLVSEAGLDLLRAEVRGHFPLGPLRRWFPRFSRAWDRLIVGRFPNLFGYEIYVCASKRC